MSPMQRPRPSENPLAKPAQRLRIGTLALAFWAALPGPSLAKAPIVHEWGTFTTLASSSGELLSGLYTDATRLPAFVHGLPFFNYGAQGWPSTKNLKGVTVKMETPVLYFYAEAETPVSVKVGFDGGTISQWYPQRYGGEANPAGPTVDLGAAPYQGSISWKATVLAKGAANPYTTSPSQETPEWTAPRQTEANLIQGQNGEIEKFLFYRGLGNFPMAVGLRFGADGKLMIRNGGDDSLPFLLVYDRQGQPQGPGGNAVIWWQGGLGPREEKTVAKPKDAAGQPNPNAAMEDLHGAMVKAGLYSMEARALLNTWYNGYFIESGLKAFWIMPRKQVDRLLPLEVVPIPAGLERVIIGRSEILTPEFEASLIAEGGALASHAKDKYHLAYLDFLAKRAAATGVARRERPAGSGRPWSLALPWEGPLSSPGMRAGTGASGSPAYLDLRGRALRP